MCQGASFQLAPGQLKDFYTCLQCYSLTFVSRIDFQNTKEATALFAIKAATLQYLGSVGWNVIQAIAQ